jgi:tetratricopeptide (TPR) repeat protein
VELSRRLTDELHSERGRRRALALVGLATLWTIVLAIAGAGALALLAPAAVAAAVLAVLATLGRSPAPPAAREGSPSRGVDIDVHAIAERLMDAARPLVGRARSLAHRAATRTRSVAASARPVAPQPAPQPRPSELDEARRLSEASASLREEGRVEEAVTSAEMAVRLFASIGDRRRQALAENRLALAHAKAGRSDEAIEHLERAGEMLGEVGDVETQGRVIANIGTLHESNGRRDLAIAHWHDALGKLEPTSPAHERLTRRLSAAT